jgi:hypothetical protein
MEPNQRLILFAHPRSGSSSLYQILQLHPALNILEEPFNESFNSWQPNLPNYLQRVHDIPSLDAVLAEIFTAYNGIKVLNYQLPDELGVHLLLRPDCIILFLQRRNLLQAVVSALIAKQTNVWQKWDMTKPLEDYYGGLAALNVEDVRQTVQAMKAQLDYFEAIVDARPDRSMIKLVYEALYFAPPAQREAQIATIWRRLELTPLDPAQIRYYLEPESVKINSAATYTWLPNAQEIQERCGSDVTGWLFE